MAPRSWHCRDQQIQNSCQHASVLSRRVSRPSDASVSPSFRSEGAGKAGPRLRPVARLRKQCRRQVPQVQPDDPALPARRFERLLRDLLGAPGLLATVSRQRAFARCADLSIGRPGPRDLTVRASVVRRRDQLTLQTGPPITSRTPRFVTTAQRPSSMRRDKREKIMNFRKSEAEYFYCRDWTAQISLNAQAKSAFCAGRFSWRRGTDTPAACGAQGRVARRARP